VRPNEPRRCCQTRDELDVLDRSRSAVLVVVQLLRSLFILHLNRQRTISIDEQHDEELVCNNLSRLTLTFVGNLPDQVRPVSIVFLSTCSSLFVCTDAHGQADPRRVSDSSAHVTLLALCRVLVRPRTIAQPIATQSDDRTVVTNQHRSVDSSRTDDTESCVSLLDFVFL
jgi:hypothetical protein